MPTLPRPVQNLLIAREVICEHAGADVVKWFCDGVDQYLTGETADEAFGLRVQRHERMAQRNELLLQVYELLRRDELHWPACESLAKLVKKFESITWPRYGASIPETQPLEIRLINEAARCHKGFPAKFPARFPRTGQAVNNAIKSAQDQRKK